MPTEKKQYLTRAEVMNLTGLSAPTIYNRVKAGMLHPVTSTRDLRANLYPAHEVEALITGAINKSA